MHVEEFAALPARHKQMVLRSNHQPLNAEPVPNRGELRRDGHTRTERYGQNLWLF